MQELGESRRRDERFEQSSAALLDKMQQMSADQTRVLQQVRESQQALLNTMNAFAVQSEEAVTRLQHNASASGHHLEDVAATMTAASQALSSGCQTFVQSVVGGLSQALGMFDQNMTALVAELNTKVDALNASGTSAETAAAVAELQRLLTDLKQVIPAKE